MRAAALMSLLPPLHALKLAVHRRNCASTRTTSEDMSCRQCAGIERQFDPRFARRELARYRRKGLRTTTRFLVDWLREERLEEMTLLDIGGGVGGIQLALLASGLRGATDVDASEAFLQIAREEAAEQGVGNRIEFIHGDFADMSTRPPHADIVTLDRVICCYDDMPRLVERSTERARMVYGLVYPRYIWWARAGAATANLWFRLRRSPMRTFVHPTREVDALLRRNGFRMRRHRKTLLWRVDLYRRDQPSVAE